MLSTIGLSQKKKNAEDSFIKYKQYVFNTFPIKTEIYYNSKSIDDHVHAHWSLRECKFYSPVCTCIYIICLPFTAYQQWELCIRTTWKGDLHCFMKDSSLLNIMEKKLGSVSFVTTEIRNFFRKYFLNFKKNSVLTLKGINYSYWIHTVKERNKQKTNEIWNFKMNI